MYIYVYADKLVTCKRQDITGYPYSMLTMHSCYTYMYICSHVNVFVYIFIYMYMIHIYMYIYICREELETRKMTGKLYFMSMSESCQ